MPFSFDVNAFWAWAVNVCNSGTAAYWQHIPERNQQTINGITYYDCSSFLFFACWQGGGLDVGALGYNNNINDYHNGTANAWNVTMMIRSLTYAGFVQYDPRTEPWQPGDILVKTRTHTEICYAAPTQTMGAHSPSGGVSINQFQTGTSYYDVLLRWPGATPPVPPPVPTQPMPIWLLKAAVDNQNLVKVVRS